MRGVSTRRVDGLVKTLGIEGISKSQVSEMAKSLDSEVAAFRSRPLDEGPYPYLWLDALAVKVREDGRIVKVAAWWPARSTPRVSARSSASTSSPPRTGPPGRCSSAIWSSVASPACSSSSPTTKRPRGGDRRHLPGASWQRCRTHFMRNLLCRVPRSAQPFVATLVRTIFAQPSPQEVAAQLERVVEQLEGRFPEVAALLEGAAPDITAFAAFPIAHWRQIWSNNPQERLNREIRRRSDVVGIFPDRDAIVRLSAWCSPSSTTSGPSRGAT